MNRALLKALFTILVSFMLAPSIAKANNSVTVAEIFINELGAEGAGTEVSLTSELPIYQIADVIDINTLALGAHVLYIRTQDETGNWSAPIKQVFVVSDTQNGLYSTLVEFKATIDGELLITGTVSTDLNSQSSIPELTTTLVDITELESGVHTISYSVKDSSDIWSTTISQVFVVPDNSNLTLSKAEYFVNTDPGEALALALQPTEGAFDNLPAIFDHTATTDNLAPGVHSVGVRTQNSAGEWSPTIIQRFFLADFDGDGIADINDEDDDGDGISDVAEVAAGTDPFDLDSDNDGVNDNLDVFPLDDTETSDNDSDGVGDIADIDDDNDGILDVNDEQPNIAIVNEFLNDTVQIEVDSLFAEINVTNTLDAYISEIAGNAVTLSEIENNGLFATGHHTAEVSLLDANNELFRTSFELLINPAVSVATSIDAFGLDAISYEVSLIGDAATYPVTIDLEVTDGLDIVEQQLLIDSGRTGTVNIGILDTALDQTITVIGAENALVQDPTSTLVLTGENLVPQVSLVVEQHRRETIAVESNSAVDIVLSFLDDEQSSHQVTLTIDDEPVDITGNNLPDESRLTLAAGELSIGQHQLSFTVAETNTLEKHTVTTEVIFVVADDVPELGGQDTDGDGLADNVEGIVDTDNDGIVDYLDDNRLNANELAVGDFKLESELNTAIRLGPYSLEVGGITASSAVITLAQLEAVLGQPTSTAAIEYLSDAFNFELSGVIGGSNAKVVVPLSFALPASAAYLVLNRDNEWVDFVTIGANEIATSTKTADGCPDPSSDAYVAGLNQGSECLLLTILDGGINDFDLDANGKVVHLGVVARNNSAPEVLLTGPDQIRELDDLELLVEVNDADGDALSVSWLILNNPEDFQVIEATDSSFTVRSSDVPADTTYEFKVQVNDGHETVEVSKTILVKHTNNSPSLFVDSDSEINEGEMIEILVEAQDEDNDELFLEVKQTAGSTSIDFSQLQLGELFNFIAPSVTADEQYKFYITVSDGEDSVTISIEILIKDVEDSDVTQRPPDNSNGDSDSSGGVMYYQLIVLVMLLIMRRRRRCNYID